MSVALSAFASQTTPKTSQQTPAAPAGTISAGSAAPKSGSAAAQAPEPPMSDEDRANQLSDQVGKLMVKCVNLLTAQDPLSLDYCKQQRDLADQYPGQLRAVDRMLAHDEYGIALAAFDHKPEALAEFNQEILLLPKAVKLGTVEWSTAYWHRAMIYSQIGNEDRADRDYRAAEISFRRAARDQGGHPDQKMRTVLRQHAALLQKEGRTEAAKQLLAEASK